VKFHSKGASDHYNKYHVYGVGIVAKFTAIVEQAQDGSWSACVVGEHTVLGTGATKEEALSDLRRGIAGLIEYLRETG
jgi:predicted RNase H-like HicB family nuclease